MVFHRLSVAYRYNHGLSVYCLGLCLKFALFIYVFVRALLIRLTFIVVALDPDTVQFITHPHRITSLEKCLFHKTACVGHKRFFFAYDSPHTLGQ